MPCYHPIKAWYPQTPGKLSFRPPADHPVADLHVPCGQCVGCRLERSRQWAIRCVHEASTHKDNCFITLTYNEDNLPANSGLDKTHYQKFMKRLRKYAGETKIRYFQCGEYGDKNLRPHYHACLFGYDFDDKYHYKDSNGIPLYISDTLDRLWTHGNCIIGDVTFDSAAYVARYIMKKITGDQSEKHYRRVDPDTGEEHQVIPEYVTMSRGGTTGGKGGIARGWYEKYKKDVYPCDNVVINGQKMQPPKYYDSLYPDIDLLKKRRRRAAAKHADNNTPERLRVREKCKNAQLNQLPRNLSED